MVSERRTGPKSVFSVITAVIVTLLVTTCCISETSAVLVYTGPQGHTVEIFAAQLWYNGFWKHPGWINATMVTSRSVDVSAKLVLLKDVFAPYEKSIRPICARGAAGIVIVRDRRGEPGQNMFVLGFNQDQRSLNCPVVEVFQNVKDTDALHDLRDNVYIEANLYPDENKWKQVQDTKFQLFGNIFLSLLEMLIISIAFYRLYQFWSFEGIRPSIGQICLAFELVATLLRFAYTLVDPFWTYRMIPDSASTFLLTLHIPFSLSSGILLTFFWAESLTKQSIKATPFISEYKKSAIVVCSLLFVGEITCDILRIYIGSSAAISPNVISGIFYLVVAVVLTTCYIICAVKILKRIGKTSYKHNIIRKMTIRFTASTAGYIILGFVDLYAVFRLNYAWSFRIVCNLIFLCFNLSAILQVWGFRPVHASRSSSRHRTNSSFKATENSSKDTSLKLDSAV